MRKIPIVAVMICVISFAASVVFADYCTVTRMPTRTNSVYEESVPAASAEVTTVRNKVVIEEVEISNSIEKAPSKTPGADLVKNTNVAPVVQERIPVGGVILENGTTAQFYSLDDFNAFFAGNNGADLRITELYMNTMPDLFAGDSNIMTSTGAGCTLVSAFSESVMIETTEMLPIEAAKDMIDPKRESYNKNVRDKIDKRNKDMRSRIDEI